MESDSRSPMRTQVSNVCGLVHNLLAIAFTLSPRLVTIPAYWLAFITLDSTPATSQAYVNMLLRYITSTWGSRRDLHPVLVRFLANRALSAASAATVSGNAGSCGSLKVSSALMMFILSFRFRVTFQSDLVHSRLAGEHDKTPNQLLRDSVGICSTRW